MSLRPDAEPEATVGEGEVPLMLVVPLPDPPPPPEGFPGLAVGFARVDDVADDD